MAKGIKFSVNGITVGTVREVAEILGHKVTKKDILDGKYPEVEVVDDECLTEEEAMEALQEVLAEPTDMDDNIEETTYDEADPSELEEDTEEDTGTTTEEDTEEDTDEEDTNEDTGKAPVKRMDELMAKLKEINAKKAPVEKSKKGKAKAIEFDGNYPEVGTFTEEKQLKKFYKNLTDEQLADWVSLEGLEYKPSDHQGINRMRMCMAIKDLHFPKPVSAPKSKSKYADYTTEQLLEMVMDNGLEVKDVGDVRILRMYCIVALREAGLLA